MNDKELMEMEIENLEEDRKLLLNHINKLQSNWNSLREWLFSEYLKKQHTEENNLIRISLLLDKMNELEGTDNNGFMD